MPIRLIEGEEPLFETLDRSRGLSNLTTNDLLVDRHGFVWIATNGGLHRFDGRNFYTIDRDPERRDSLRSRRVYRLAETPKALWLGFVDGKLQRLDMATGHITSIPLNLPGAGAPHSLSWMHSDAHDRLWLLTNLGLLRFDPSSQRVVRAAGSLQAAQLSPDRHRLLMVTDDFQIMELETDSLAGRRLARFSEPDSSRGVKMAADDRGLWLSMGTQLWRFDTASASLRRIDIPALPITRMVAERNGTLWMSTRSHEGLYRFDLQRRELSLYRYRPGDLRGLRVKIIRTLALSPDGNLWIGGFSGGVSRVRARNAVTRIDLKGSRPEIICGLHENLESQLFVSLCERVIRLDPASGQITDLTPELERATRARKSSLWVHGMIGDGGNGLWIVTAFDGLLHWRPGRATVQFPHEQELVNALLDEKQRVWVSHVNGLAVLLPGSQGLREVSARTREGAFEFGRTSDVARGPNGTLLVGTTEGVVQYWPESGQARRFPSEEGNPRSLSDNNVIASYTDPSGRLWVGTFSGLNRMMVDEKGESAFRRYGRIDGLPDTSIYSMLSDGSGALWVATDRGLARWDPRMDRFQSYLPADGIPDVSLTGEAGLSRRDNNLYFGTDDGLWRIDLRELQVAKSNPTVLSGYEVGEKKVINLRGRDLQGIQARYLDRRLTFLFAALGDPRNLFYRLAGFDNSWQSMPANLTVGYHQLPPGTYRLEVSRQDGQGQRVQDLTIPVTITPPIWRTTWAYAGYVLAVAAALAWLVRAYVIRRRRRREYLRTLREHDERLRLAMSASGDVMIEVDLKNDNVTETGDDRSHHSNQSLRISDYLALVHPDDIEPVSHYFEALQEPHAQDLQIEYRRRAEDGDWRWVRLRGQFIERQRNGDVHEMFTGMIHDITQERSDRELRLRTDQLRMQAEVRGQFLAVISHEIRTPLNGVVGMIELLDATPLDKDQSRMLAACKDSASVLMSIINDFLDLSKIEAGKLELERSDVSLRDLVDAAASGHRLQARNRGLDLDIHVAPQVPSCIVGDRVRLRQVLDNLISNAIKFTERGGVEVAMYMEVPGELRLTVTDTGIGMDEETVENLFQPFRQASATTARRFGGTGLGLSIVRHLVEIMGGRIACKSRVNEGTCFSILLPVQACAAPEPADRLADGVELAARGATHHSTPQPRTGQAEVAPRAPSDHPAITGEVILLAEDNPINREVITRQLDRLGHSCETAEDGEEAWNLLQSNPDRYNLLITDAQMPRLDGYRLAERIRQLEKSTGRRRIKIIMATAGVLTGERERCLALDMDGFLAKPLLMDALEEKLAELLPKPVATVKGESDQHSPGALEGLSALLDLLQGDQVSFRRILEIFLRTTHADMQSLEAAVQGGDRLRAGELAHRLKSACYQLGQDMAGQALEDLERAARSARADDASFDGLVAAAKHEVARSQRLVEEYLAPDPGVVRIDTIPGNNNP